MRTSGMAFFFLLAAACALAQSETSVRSRAKVGRGPADTSATFFSAMERRELKRDLSLIAREEVAGAKEWQRKKSSLVAVLSNMVLPGLGEVYNGRRIKAAVMVGLSTIYMGKAWIEHKRAVTRRMSRDRYLPNTRRWRFHDDWYNFHKDQSLDYVWWSSAIWLIGMLDAYVDAHLFDLRAYEPRAGGGKYLVVASFTF